MRDSPLINFQSNEGENVCLTKSIIPVQKNFPRLGIIFNFKLII